MTIGGNTYDVTVVTNTTTATTYATQTGQNRTGLNTTVVPRIDTTALGDKLISSVVIPLMRERNVAFLAIGLKSLTSLYALFDGTHVNAYVTPATVLRLNDVGGFTNTYDYSSNAGSNATLAARKISGVLDLSLSKGYIVRGATSGATGVVLFQEERAPAATATNIHIANVIGTFQNGETVYGAMDGGTVGSRGTVASVPTVKNMGDVLLTNYSGGCAGIFHIPVGNFKFRSGVRELVLRDTLDANSTTSALAQYEATGTLNTYQQQFLATRNADVVQQATNETRVLTNTFTTSSSARTAKTFADPLAQTFLVDNTGGIFATKVDLYFSKKELVKNTPVHIEIREVVNGFPASFVAPFSKVYLDPFKVNVSATGSAPTTFTFKSPVYLSEGKEYALVVLSDSDNYHVFISQTSEVDILTGQKISTQPTLGVLFKSSNGSTWQADQTQDLKFTLYRAKFDIASPGLVNLTNGVTPLTALKPNPFQITSGSTLVRVSHPNHQMSVGSTVTISGSAGVGNVPNTEINGNKVISNTDLDSYTITVTTSPTSTIPGGGSVVFATENVTFDTLHVNTTELLFQDTSISYQMKTTSGQSADAVSPWTLETPYVKDASYSTLHANDNVTFASPRVIASTINETTNMAAAKSMDILATLSSLNDAVSPVLDTQRLSVICINNKINSPTMANVNVSALDNRAILSVANKIGFDNTTNSMYTAVANTTEYNALLTLTAGKYINVTGSVAGTGANNGDALVLRGEVVATNFYVYLAKTIAVEAPSGGVTITIVQHERFVDEISPVFGSVANKYVSREIILAQPSTYIKLKVAANIPPQANLAFYYKVNPVGSSVALASRSWIQMTPNATPVKTTTGNYSDIDIDVMNIQSFDTMQVKIVMSSNSSAQVPTCKDLRIVACA